jgi:DNA ligase D-like protein (predicted ligase)
MRHSHKLLKQRLRRRRANVKFCDAPKTPKFQGFHKTKLQHKKFRRGLYCAALALILEAHDARVQKQSTPNKHGKARFKRTPPPRFVEPQLSLVEKAPSGPDWVHETKFDGYRIGARIDRSKVTPRTRSGRDWTDKYPATASALSKLPVENAYIDGELCGIGPNGISSFALIQAATDSGAGALVYFAFDLLFVDGESIQPLPLSERKARLAKILTKPPPGITYSEHVEADGEQVRKAACTAGMEGVVSKRRDQPYKPGERGIWVKSKCPNRAEFVIIGWTDPEGSRVLLGSLLLGYYDKAGRLVYAGRVGTGMPDETLRMLHRKLKPLAVAKMPLDEKPPRKSRYGTPLELSRVHWVKPKLVAEVTYLRWTADNLLRHTVFIGLREDKPAREVRREASDA